MEQIDIENQEPSRKIYSINSIWSGTFLGGPLAAGYLIAENFKTFDQRNKVTLTWTITILTTIGLICAIFMIPEIDKIPRQLIPLVYASVAYAIVHKFQADKIKVYTAGTFSFWRSFGIGLICSVVTALPIVGYFLLNDPVITASTSSYGALKHEILYQKSNIPEADVNKIADALTKSGFFDEEQQKSILLEKKNESYIISISLIKDAWYDPEVISYFGQLREDVQTSFTASKIIINLCSDEDITEIKKVLK